MKEKTKKIDNIIAAITVFLYLISIAIYELLFCNSELMNYLLRDIRKGKFDI